MRTKMKTLGHATLLIVALGSTSLVYASEQDRSEGPSMSHGGMGGMMNMMQGMSGMMNMMSSCPMMQQGGNPGPRTSRPNEQWREKPSADKKEGG